MENKNYKTIPIRLTNELHKKMRHLSIDTGISINEYVVKALTKIVENYEMEKTNGKK